MKNLIVCLSAFLFSMGAFAQKQDTSITTTKETSTSIELGVRLGNNFGVDAVLPFAKSSRAHVGVEIFPDGINLGAYADWVFAINEAAGLSAFMGVGPEFYLRDNFDFAVAGDFGIEYNINNFPMKVGFDYRPSFILTGADFRTSNWGFTARYQF
ncbi:MAG: hypothetical protein ACPGRE_04325 [Flavobacteriaceae bacterium]